MTDGTIFTILTTVLGTILLMMLKDHLTAGGPWFIKDTMALAAFLTAAVSGFVTTADAGVRYANIIRIVACIGLSAAFTAGGSDKLVPLDSISQLVGLSRSMTEKEQKIHVVHRCACKILQQGGTELKKINPQLGKILYEKDVTSLPSYATRGGGVNAAVRLGVLSHIWGAYTHLGELHTGPLVSYASLLFIMFFADKQAVYKDHEFDDIYKALCGINASGNVTDKQQQELKTASGPTFTQARQFLTTPRICSAIAVLCAGSVLLNVDSTMKFQDDVSFFETPAGMDMLDLLQPFGQDDFIFDSDYKPIMKPEPVPDMPDRVLQYGPNSYQSAFEDNTEVVSKVVEALVPLERLGWQQADLVTLARLTPKVPAQKMDEYNSKAVALIDEKNWQYYTVEFVITVVPVVAPVVIMGGAMAATAGLGIGTLPMHLVKTFVFFSASHLLPDNFREWCGSVSEGFSTIAYPGIASYAASIYGAAPVPVQHVAYQVVYQLTGTAITRAATHHMRSLQNGSHKEYEFLSIVNSVVPQGPLALSMPEATSVAVAYAKLFRARLSQSDSATIANFHLLLKKQSPKKMHRVQFSSLYPPNSVITNYNSMLAVHTIWRVGSVTWKQGPSMRLEVASLTITIMLQTLIADLAEVNLIQPQGLLASTGRSSTLPDLMEGVLKYWAILSALLGFLKMGGDYFFKAEVVYAIEMKFQVFLLYLIALLTSFTPVTTASVLMATTPFVQYKVPNFVYWICDIVGALALSCRIPTSRSIRAHGRRLLLQMQISTPKYVTDMISLSPYGPAGIVVREIKEVDTLEGTDKGVWGDSPGAFPLLVHGEWGPPVKTKTLDTYFFIGGNVTVMDSPPDTATPLPRAVMNDTVVTGTIIVAGIHVEFDTYPANEFGGYDLVGQRLSSYFRNPNSVWRLVGSALNGGTVRIQQPALASTAFYESTWLGAVNALFVAWNNMVKDEVGSVGMVDLASMAVLVSVCAQGMFHHISRGGGLIYKDGVRLSGNMAIALERLLGFPRTSNDIVGSTDKMYLGAILSKFQTVDNDESERMDRSDMVAGSLFEQTVGRIRDIINIETFVLEVRIQRIPATRIS